MCVIVSKSTCRSSYTKYVTNCGEKNIGQYRTYKVMWYARYSLNLLGVLPIFSWGTKPAKQSIFKIKCSKFLSQEASCFCFFKYRTAELFTIINNVLSVVFYFLVAVAHCLNLFFAHKLRTEECALWLQCQIEYCMNWCKHCTFLTLKKSCSHGEFLEVDRRKIKYTF